MKNKSRSQRTATALPLPYNNCVKSLYLICFFWKLADEMNEEWVWVVNLTNKTRIKPLIHHHKMKQKRGSSVIKRDDALLTFTFLFNRCDGKMIKEDGKFGLVVGRRLIHNEWKWNELNNLEIYLRQRTQMCWKSRHRKTISHF